MSTSTRGFTLTELLVVIAIISILASMLMPAIATVRLQAAKSSCRNNLRSVAIGTVAYCGDNEGFFPMAVNDDWSDPLWSKVLGSLTSSSPASAYPAAAENPYYGGGPMPFLYCSLLNYDVVPVAPSGKVPANWRCPARQEKVLTSGRPWMRAYNATWRISYWWNYPNAGNVSDAQVKGLSRARLVWDHFWPDWLNTDLMHKDATTNVAFADGHAEIVPFQDNFNLQAVHSQAGITTNAWYADGWSR